MPVVAAGQLSRSQTRVVTLILVPATLLVLAAFVAARYATTPLLADWLDNLHWTVAYGTAAVLAWLGVRWADEETRDARRWFAIGMAISFIAQLTWDVQTAIGLDVFPAPSDWLFISFGPCCVVGLWHTIRRQPNRPPTWALLLDLVTLAAVVSMVVLALFLPRHTSPVGMGLIVKVAYPISMLTTSCLAVVMVATLRLSPSPQSATFVIASMANGLIWLTWLYLAQEDALISNTWLYLAFSLVTLAMGAGALLWHVHRATNTNWIRRCDFTARILPLLVVGAAIISAVLAWSVPGTDQTAATVVYLNSGLVMVLAAIRQSVLLFERDRLLAIEKRHTELERTFQTLFQITRGGLALLNHDGRFREINPSCIELLGYSREQLLLTTIDAVHVGPAFHLQGPLGLVDANGNGVIETFFRRLDGTLVDVELTSALIPDSGGQVFVILRNITERKQAEATRQRLEAQLRQSQKLEAIGTLASGIAHDFNNILGAILGNIELALQDLSDDHLAQTSMQEIRKAGQRGKDLIRRIVAFGKPYELEFKPTQLAAVIEDSLKLVRAVLPATVEINCQLDAHLPPVSIDSSQIAQVLLNLCTNAYQAMDQQKGRINITLNVQEFGDDTAQHNRDIKPGRYACLHISDTGSGIDPAIVDRIFEPFFTTKSMTDGSGLGLSIVHNIVRSHDGAIVLESERGSGSTFHIYLPAPTSLEAAEASAKLTIARAPAKGAGQHLLYVDDEESLVFLTKRMLERFGYRVTGFTEPDVALQAALAEDADFDLIITDHSMPVMSGIDLARELFAKRPDSRIVLVSGYLPPHDVDRARATGIHDVILKPNTVDELAAAVHRLLSA